MHGQGVKYAWPGGRVCMARGWCAYNSFWVNIDCHIVDQSAWIKSRCICSQRYNDL